MIAPSAQGLIRMELAQEVDVATVRQATWAPLIVPEHLPLMELT
jgi:hypothetical protein